MIAGPDHLTADIALRDMREEPRIKAQTLSRGLVAGSVVGGFVLLFSIVLLLQSSLAMVARQTNVLDDARSQEAMRAALNMSLGHMSNAVEINSVWDDAVKHVYAKTLDADWLYSSYGALAKADSDYDGVYIVDASGAVLWGAVNQQRVFPGSLDQVAPGLNRYFPAFARHPASDPISRLVSTPTGPALAGIGLIQPSSDSVAMPWMRPHYLVLTRHLSAPVLHSFAAAYSVDGLKWLATAPSAQGPLVHLTGVRGEDAGYLTWTTRNTGLAAALAVAPKIRFSLLLVAVLMLCMVAGAVWGVRRLRRSEMDARVAALIDPLTGLPNRGAFMSQLRSHVREHLALAFLDLDRFKQLNDAHGTASVDLILKDIAGRVSPLAGENIHIARIAGDQFGVLTWGPDAPQALKAVVNSIQTVLAPPFEIGAGQVGISATMGVTSTDVAGHDREELCRQAMAALAKAKAEFRGGVCRYDAELDKQLKATAAIETQIRHGLDHDEFEVFYQPIVGAFDGTLSSVEALVRWPRRPEGPLPPDEFIAIAEQAGLIHELGQFVLRRACTDLLHFGDFRVSVNVSPAQFHDPRFLGDVRAVLQDLNFPAGRLELEITEGYLIDLPGDAENAIRALHDMGIAIALDDFGVGYSSIGYLRRYEFDKLKIDKSLAATVGADPKAGALVLATVALAKALQIPVTAEGVETVEQASLLQLAGCTTLQGYLFGRPQSIGDLKARADIVSGQVFARSA